MTTTTTTPRLSTQRVANVLKRAGVDVTAPWLARRAGLVERLAELEKEGKS